MLPSVHQSGVFGANLKSGFGSRILLSVTKECLLGASMTDRSVRAARGIDRSRFTEHAERRILRPSEETRVRMGNPYLNQRSSEVRPSGTVP